MKSSFLAFVNALPVPATLVVGGSRALEEGTPESDTDVYLITKTMRDLRVLLHKKESVRPLKQQQGIEHDLILVSRWLLAHRFYYLYGQTPDGSIISAPVDCILQRNYALKVAYRCFVEAQLVHEVDKTTYLLKKALRYGIYSAALAQNNRLVAKGPLFSTAALLASDEVSEDAKQFLKNERIKQWDSTFTIVKRVLEDAYQLFCIQPFSWRSQCLYLVFGLRNGNLAPLFKNMDQWIIKELRELAARPDEKAYQKIKKQLLMILFI